MKTKSADILNRNDAGFSAVEMLITIFIAAIFVLAFNMLFTSLLQSSSMTRDQDMANDLAYTYLRKYAHGGAKPTWFTCDATVGSGNTNDLKQNPNAPGQTLTSGSLTTTETKLPSPVSYQVVAHAVYGCSGSDSDSPIRVTSRVTYGPNNLVVSHATYVGNN